MRCRVAICSVALAVMLPTTAAAKGSHTVAAGETLWKIAQKYGCEVAAVTKLNRLKSNLIHPGDTLRIPRCKRPAKIASSRPAPRMDKRLTVSPGMREHRVVSGDTLGKIARKYETSIESIQMQNGLDGITIYAGQTLLVVPHTGSGPAAVFGQSVGRPAGGRLVKPARLRPDSAYYIRRPKRTYGTNHTVYHVRNAARIVRRRYPRAHRLAVGDLSVRRGGKITMHASHQSGRDADLGFYFKRRPRGYPRSFIDATARNLDIGATWLLIDTLARTHKASGGVERMFISYDTQKLIYKLARKRGVSRKRLDEVFQYPNGRGSLSGIVRHEPYHNDHIHVRFKCPKGDSGCY